MKEIEGNGLRSYKEAPWPDKHIVHEDENVVVYKDGYPVTEGHLLFVPKKKERQLDITQCFELAYKWGVKGIMDYKWVAFNVGINNGVEAGQSVMWPHVHLIPRRRGDLGWFENGTPYDPRGGVRNIIPHKGPYENRSCPAVDDNTLREELDSWTKTTAKATAKGVAAKEDGGYPIKLVEGEEEENIPFNDAQMLNGTYEGDTISKIVKKTKPRNPGYNC